MIYSIISRKGGCSKTTTAINMAAVLRELGYTTLLIDLDSQGNLTYTAGVLSQSENTILDVLTGKVEVFDAIMNTQNGDIIAASSFLSGADQHIRKESALKDALKPISGLYDYIICDLPSQLGSVTVNALTASDVAIIPLQADVFSLQSLPLTFQIIETVQGYSNPNLTVAGLLVTRYSNRAIISRDMLQNLQKAAAHYGTKVFDTQIRENSAVKEACAVQSNIIDYAPRSNGAVDYRSFTQELINRP